MLPIIFVMPFIQLIILSNAATFEIKNIKFAYIDHDHTSTSRALVEKFEASKYFNVEIDYPSEELASAAMLKGDVDVILEIPRFFERDFLVPETGRNTVSGALRNSQELLFLNGTFWYQKPTE